VAATDVFRRAPPAPAGALPQTPALLRDRGAIPNGGEGGGARGISSPGGHRCHRTPGQVKGALASHARAQAPPLPRPGNRWHHQGLPDEEMPDLRQPRGSGPAGGRARTTVNRRSVRTKQKDHLPGSARPRRVTVDDTEPLPDSKIWENRVSIRLRAVHGRLGAHRLRPVQHRLQVAGLGVEGRPRVARLAPADPISAFHRCPVGSHATVSPAKPAAVDAGFVEVAGEVGKGRRDRQQVPDDNQNAPAVMICPAGLRACR